MSREVSAKPPRINIWIQNLSPEEVLTRVAELGELVIQRERNVIKVMTFQEYIRLHGVEKKVVQLKYVDAKEVVSLLKPFTSKEDQARILAHETGNRIVLLVPQLVMESFVKLISELDQPLETETIRIIRLQHREAATIGPVIEQFLTEAVGGAHQLCRQSAVDEDRGRTSPQDGRRKILRKIPDRAKAECNYFEGSGSGC